MLEHSWGHGTQKPVECMRRPIVNNSRPGQAIYDPFLGSRRAEIAALKVGDLHRNRGYDSLRVMSVMVGFSVVGWPVHHA